MNAPTSPTLTSAEMRPDRPPRRAPSWLGWPVVVLALVCAVLLAATAPAQGAEPAAAAAADPPGRVGRISELQGRVSWFDQQLGRWEDAERNLPLTTGDRLSTGDGARAELRVGSTVLRLDGASELEVLRLDDERLVFQLHSGALALRVRTRELASEVELVTREARLLPQRAGHYRVGRRDDETQAGVWHGTLRVAVAGDGSERGNHSDTSDLMLDTGQYAELWREPGAGVATALLRHRLLPPPADAFAEWVVLDDRREEQRSVAQQHVSPEMTGAEDLDRHGRWERHPDYGVLWFPFEVRVGWAPYRHGRWAWVSPWGWTWVDQAPWGFAPFHYGRWVHWQGRWGWWPGERVARPVYAPALVAWVGSGGWNLSVQLGGGPAIGWVPLAPRERFVPPYRHTPGHLDRLNPPRHGPRDDRRDERWEDRRAGGRELGRDSGRRDGDAGRDGPRGAERDPSREGPRDAPRDRSPDRGEGGWRNAQVPGAVTVVGADVLQRRLPLPRDGHPARGGAERREDPLQEPRTGRQPGGDRSDDAPAHRPGVDQPFEGTGRPGWVRPGVADGRAGGVAEAAAELQPARPPEPARSPQPLLRVVRGEPLAAPGSGAGGAVGDARRPGDRVGGRDLDAGRVGSPAQPAPAPVGPAAPGWRAAEPRSTEAVVGDSPGLWRDRRPAPPAAPAVPLPGAGPSAAPPPSAVPSLPPPAPVWRQRDRDAGRAPPADERTGRVRPEPPSAPAAHPARPPDERKFRPDVRPDVRPGMREREAQR